MSAPENLERQISIQVANMPDGSYDVHKEMPYPFHITDELGAVGRQDFWKGEPARLLGFQRGDAHRVDVTAATFWHLPEQVVGMRPVFQDADGGIWSHMNPITHVTVHGITNEGEVI